MLWLGTLLLSMPSFAAATEHQSLLQLLINAPFVIDTIQLFISLLMFTVFLVLQSRENSTFNDKIKKLVDKINQDKEP